MKVQLLISLALGCAMCASAAHLTPEQALERAIDSGSQMRVKSLKARQLKQVKVNAENVYVFSSADNQGFVITSADDRLRPVLGYADNGNIDAENMSPELAWWLSEYDREISALMPGENITSLEAPIQESVQTKSAVTDNYAQWSSIAPLVTTKWNQSTPYNDLCPYQDNNSSNGRSVTGCVATAMAQVVYYHKYYSGAGSKTYTPSSWSEGQTVSFNYGSTAINFSVMKDTYSSSDSGTTSGNAVATLMKACGVGVEMNYRASASGASSAKIPTALVTYMGYDATGTKYYDRSNFSTDKFEALIYHELINNRPVLYGGSSPNGGHQFIVDGYDSNGMFHLNWGWGGVSDGYFTLTALNPGEQGIGSSEGGYNYWQDIVTVAPPGASNFYKIESTNGLKGNFLLTSDTKFKTQIYYGGPDDTISFMYGLQYYDQNGNLVKTTNGFNYEYQKYHILTWGEQPATTSDLKAGKYEIHLCYQSSSGEWIELKPMNGGTTIMSMTINADSSYSLELVANKPLIRLTNIENPQIYSQKANTLSFHAVNNSDTEVYDGVGFVITNEKGTARYFNICGTEYTGMLSDWSYETAFPVDQARKIGLPLAAGKLSAGKYTLKLYGSYGQLLSDDTLEFEVLSGSGAAAETLTSNWTVYDESVIPDLWMKGDTFTHTVKIKSASAQTNSACFAVVLWNKGTNTIAQSWVGNYAWGLTSATIYNISALNANGEVFTIDVPFGTYDLQYFIFPNVANVNILSYKSSQRRTIRVGEKIGDYVLAPDDNGNGIAVIGGPVGNVEVPETFTVSGSTLPVTEIAEGLYRYSKELTGISLPSSVEKIGTYAFDGCSNLDYVVLNNAEPIFDYVQVIAQNSKNDCAWYVPRGSYDSYSNTLTGRKLFEIPSAMSGTEVYMDLGEEATLQSPFAEPGVYNYTVSNSAPTVVSNDTNLNVSALTEGAANITVSTPAPFDDSVDLTVNVIRPEDCDVDNLAELWQHLATDELLPTPSPGTMRSRNHYIMAKGMHVFDRQADYAMVTDLHWYNNERMHGFKITGLPESTNHANVLNVTGRLVTENGVHSLRVNNVTTTEDAATPDYFNLPYGSFDPATDAGEWLHTYAKLWYVTYDHNNNVLTGFSKARSANASELPIMNLNNVILPTSSNRYDPVGYIDADSEGNYFFVPTADFGDVSTGVSEIDVDANTTDARYFNLQGIEMHGKLQPGIYVRKSADVATKVVVR